MPRFAINSDGDYELLSDEKSELPQIDGLVEVKGVIDYNKTLEQVYKKYIDIKLMSKDVKVNDIKKFEDSFIKRYFRNKTGKFTYTLESTRLARSHKINGKDATIIDVTLTMNNAEDELAVLLMLIKKPHEFGPDVDEEFMDIMGWARSAFQGRTAIADTFLRNMRFLNTQVIKSGKRGRPKKSDQKVINPLSGKPIQFGKATYKRLFKTVRLKKVEYKQLSDIETIDYDIPKGGNCVVSFVKHKFGKKYAKKLPDVPTYPDIFEALSGKVDVFVYDRVGNRIDHCFNNRDERLHMIIHNDHMYIVDPIEEKKKTVVLLPAAKKGSTARYYTNYIENITNSEIIVTDEKKMNMIHNYIIENYEAGGYSNSVIKFKTNIIRFDPRYEDYLKYSKSFGCKAFTLFSLMNKFIGLPGGMNKLLGLLGCMNRETFDIMSKDTNVISESVGEMSDLPTVSFDLNKSYPSILYDYKFPIPDINDFVEDYEDTPIVSYNFYYCVVKNPHIILAPRNGFYYGYLVRRMLEHDNDCKSGEKIIKKIKYVLRCSDYTKIDKCVLPDKDGKCSDTNFTFNYLREYTGWLRTFVNKETKIYDNLTDVEIDALKAFHSQVSSGFAIDNKKSVIIQNVTTKTSHGLLAYMAITQINNLKLYDFDVAIRKENKNIELHWVKTDCIGYKFKDDKYKVPSNMIGKDAGLFKICEIDKKYRQYIDEHSECLIDKHAKIDRKDEFVLDINTKRPSLKILKKDKITDLLDNHESFILEGPPGVGKTYTVVEEIIPYLEDNDMDYVLCSTTLEQGFDLHKKMTEKFGEIEAEEVIPNSIKELNYNLFKEERIEKEKKHKPYTLFGIDTEYVQTIQSLLDKRNDNELISYFKNVHYLIIDEAVQLSEELLSRLEFLTRKTKCKLIAMSDKYQCVVGNWKGTAYIDTPFTHKLFDYNSVKLDFHGNMRYDAPLRKIVEFMLNNFDDPEKIYSYIEKHFKHVKKPKPYVLAYTHKEKNKAKSEYGCTTAITVHSAQGKTIIDEYTLWDIRRMDVRVLYTAISRAKKKSQITLFDPDNVDDSDSDSGSDSDE